MEDSPLVATTSIKLESKLRVPAQVEESSPLIGLQAPCKYEASSPLIGESEEAMALNQ